MKDLLHSTLLGQKRDPRTEPLVFPIIYFCPSPKRRPAPTTHPLEIVITKGKNQIIYFFSFFLSFFKIPQRFVCIYLLRKQRFLLINYFDNYMINIYYI